MNEEHELIGTIERIMFQASDTGFAVFQVQVKSNQSITARGYLHAIHAGEQVTLTGSWVTHPKWGRQFEAQSCIVVAPTTPLGLKKYLASGLIKGIGPVYAERLVDHFGDKVLEIITHEPARLAEVPGIGDGRIQKIVCAWHDQKELSRVMVFLQDKGISSTYAIKIYKKYGQNAIAIVQENPYRLATDIWGIGFKLADQIARTLGIASDSLQRISAGIIHVITTVVGNGHLYVQLNELKQATRELLDFTDSDQQSDQREKRLSQALHDLYERREVILVTHHNNHYITLPLYYYAELGIAKKIKELQNYPHKNSFDVELLDAKLSFAQHEHDVLLNQDQKDGIITCLKNKVSVITGGPGTGKTTLIKKLLYLLDTEHISYKIAAPTGRAAKRITENTGRHAVTIHRLLAFDFATYTFTHNENNSLNVGFLIIDEASMLDVFLAHALLKALPLPAHIVFIGDIDQLPSVGSGNFLNDLIASHCAPTIRLKQIFRQAHNSLIIVNAHKVNNGEFPVSSVSAGSDANPDFIFIKENDPARVQEHLARLFSGGIQRRGIKQDNALVLVPMNKGQLGTHVLNQALQQIVNPGTNMDVLVHAGTTFKVGDRVMQLRNNYDKLVFNGDIGPIVAIDVHDKTITVSYFGRYVVYEACECDELVLAYAVTIHKSQGSEYDAVVIPIFMQHFVLLQRNLLYTAITRAKKLCILIGQPKAIAVALANNKSTERTTFLQQYLTTDLVCR